METARAPPAIAETIVRGAAISPIVRGGCARAPHFSLDITLVTLYTWDKHRDASASRWKGEKADEMRNQEAGEEGGEEGC